MRLNVVEMVSSIRERTNGFAGMPASVERMPAALRNCPFSMVKAMASRQESTRAPVAPINVPVSCLLLRAAAEAPGTRKKAVGTESLDVLINN